MSRSHHGFKVTYSYFLVKISTKILKPLKLGPIAYPEMSVRNYHYMLRKSPGERNSMYLSINFTRGLRK
jgi:hypothetical protein